MDRETISKALEGLTQFEETVGPIALVHCSYEMVPYVEPWIRPSAEVRGLYAYDNFNMLIADEWFMTQVAKGRFKELM